MSNWIDAVNKVIAMSDDQLRAVWANLGDYGADEYYAPGVSMNEWASLVYSEMCRRGLPR